MAVFKDTARGTWYAKFYYTDWQGKRRQTLKRGFIKKSDAQKYEKDIKDRSTQSPTLSLNELSKHFLDDYKLHRRPNSYKLTDNNLRLHILPYVGKLPVNEITPLTVRTWQNEILKTDLSKSTIHAINTTFKTIMTYAVKYFNLAYSPFMRCEPIGKIEGKHNFIPLDDWGRLMAVIDNKHDRAAFSLLYWSGVRVGELQGLTPADIDFNNNTININKQYSSDNKEIAPLKTDKSKRVIAIPDFCMDIVKAYFNALVEIPPYPFTLHTSRGLNYRLKQYCIKADICPVSVHALRHSHASLLIKQGIPVNLISERLGHATPTVTLKIYSHVYENQDNELAKLLHTLGKNTPA